MLNYHQKTPQRIASYSFEAIAELERLICIDLQGSSAVSLIGKGFQANQLSF